MTAKQFCRAKGLNDGFVQQLLEEYHQHKLSEIRKEVEYYEQLITDIRMILNNTKDLYGMGIELSNRELINQIEEIL